MELQVGLFDNMQRKAYSRCVIVDGVNDVPLVWLDQEADGTVRRYTISVQARVTVVGKVPT